MVYIACCLDEVSKCLKKWYALSARLFSNPIFSNFKYNKRYFDLRHFDTLIIELILLTYHNLLLIQRIKSTISCVQYDENFALMKIQAN